MRLVLRIALGAALGLGALLTVSFLRPNQSRVHPALGIESWAAVADGEHNSNTDLILWRGDLLLVHAASPYHMAPTATSSGAPEPETAEPGTSRPTGTSTANRCC